MFLPKSLFHRPPPLLLRPSAPQHPPPSPPSLNLGLLTSTSSASTIWTRLRHSSHKTPRHPSSAWALLPPQATRTRSLAAAPTSLAQLPWWATVIASSLVMIPASALHPNRRLSATNLSPLGKQSGVNYGSGSAPSFTYFPNVGFCEEGGGVCDTLLPTPKSQFAPTEGVCDL